jgi:hypothetical protein
MHMTLWTWQTSGFDICRDRIDLGRSHYHNHADGIPQKYQRVFERLNTRDLVWCFTVDTPWKSNQTTENRRVSWTLEVPISEIMCFVDELLVGRLLTDKLCPDIATWRSWRREAVAQHPNRPDRQHEFIETKLGSFAGRISTADEAWRGFFLDEPEAAEHVTALLRCPIDSNWIIECPVPNCRRPATNRSNCYAKRGHG